MKNKKIILLISLISVFSYGENSYIDKVDLDFCPSIIPINNFNIDEYCYSYRNYTYSNQLIKEYREGYKLKNLNIYNNEEVYYILSKDYEEYGSLKKADFYFQKALKMGQEDALKEYIETLISLKKEYRSAAYYRVLKALGYNYKKREAYFNELIFSNAGESVVQSYATDILNEIKNNNKKVTSFEMFNKYEKNQMLFYYKNKKDYSFKLAKLIHDKLKVNNIYPKDHIDLELVQLMRDMYYNAGNNGNFKAQNIMIDMHYSGSSSAYYYTPPRTDAKMIGSDLIEHWFESSNNKEELVIKYMDKLPLRYYEFNGFRLNDDIFKISSNYIVKQRCKHSDNLDCHWRFGNLIAYNYFIRGDYKNARKIVDLTLKRTQKGRTVSEILDKVLIGEQQHVSDFYNDTTFEDLMKNKNFKKSFENLRSQDKKY